MSFRFGFNASGCSNIVRWWVLPSLVAMLLGGCLPAEADFEFGLGTSRITGFMTPVLEGLVEDGGLVVVYRKHHQFITHGDGSAVLSQTARVYPVGRAGTFSVDMPSDVVAVELLFIAPDHLSRRFQLERQLGVGDITYRADLVPMKDWRSHYYTFLLPQLEHLIVETRYRLPPEGVELLSKWLQHQNSRAGAGGTAGAKVDSR